MARHLVGKVALVTGGGRGIGRAICLALAESGAKVVVNDYGGRADATAEPSSEPANQVVAEIKAQGGDAVADAGNVASMADAESMVQKAIDAWGKIDIAVTPAGILRDRMIFNMTEEEWDDVIAVHLKGQFTIAKYCSIAMRAQRSGRLVFFSSGAAFNGPGTPNYAAAKSGVLGLTRSCALALGRSNITANAILPMAATRLVDYHGRDRLERGESPISELAIGSPLDPANVAGFVVYLCSDEAQHISGQYFQVGGGEITLYRQPEPRASIFKDGIWEVDEIFAHFKAIGALVEPLPAAERNGRQGIVEGMLQRITTIGG